MAGGSPEREISRAAIDRSQVIGRSSLHTLYDRDLVTFEAGARAHDHRDAEGFIKLNALRPRVKVRRDARVARPRP